MVSNYVTFDLAAVAKAKFLMATMRHSSCAVISSAVQAELLILTSRKLIYQSEGLVK